MAIKKSSKNKGILFYVIIGIIILLVIIGVYFLIKSFIPAETISSGASESFFGNFKTIE